MTPNYANTSPSLRTLLFFFYNFRHHLFYSVFSAIHFPDLVFRTSRFLLPFFSSFFSQFLFSFFSTLGIFLHSRDSPAPATWFMIFPSFLQKKSFFSLFLSHIFFLRICRFLFSFLSFSLFDHDAFHVSFPLPRLFASFSQFLFLFFSHISFIFFSNFVFFF